MNLKLKIPIIKNELLLLWRGDLGNPRWVRWHKLLLFVYLLILAISFTLPFLTSKKIADTSGNAVAGFALTLFIWASFKVIHLLQNPTNQCFFILSPTYRSLQMSMKFTAHGLYLGSLLFFLLLPSLIYMIVGGHSYLISSIVFLCIIGLSTISLSWLYMCLVSYLWGVESARFALKTTAFLLSIVMTTVVILYPQTFIFFTSWWNSKINSIVLSLFLLVGSILLATMAIILSQLTMKRLTFGEIQPHYRSAKLLKYQAFRALLAKEFRLLSRMLRKAILFIIFNYIVSFLLVIFLFRYAHPNDTFLYVSLMMFIFVIYIAGPSNMLSACESSFGKTLRLSPTPIYKVVLAKTLAVYAIMGPISLAAGLLVLKFVVPAELPLLITLGIGLGVGFISVWTGAIETLIKMLGLTYQDMLHVSLPSMLGSLLIIILSFMHTQWNTSLKIILLVLALTCYLYSILVSINKLSKNNV